MVDIADFFGQELKRTARPLARRLIEIIDDWIRQERVRLEQAFAEGSADAADISMPALYAACMAACHVISGYQKPSTRVDEFADACRMLGELVASAPIEHRKQKLSRLVRGPRPGIVLNEHYDGDGDVVLAHACKLGCEGIVSKRVGSPYRSGRSPYWVKVKNPKAPAVTREAEEDWGR
jgi:hypothetical protein